MREAWLRIVALAGAAAIATGLAACTSSPPPESLAAERIVVIGDEVGGWTEQLAPLTGARVEVDAVAGSGYLTASPGSVAERLLPFRDQVDTVVLALGAADVQADPPDAIRDAAARQAVSSATAIAEVVVVVAPLSPPGTSRDAWAEALAEAAAQAGATFTDVELPADAWAGDALTDGAARELARRVADSLPGR